MLHSFLRSQYYDMVIDMYFNQEIPVTRICKIVPVSRAGIYKWLRKFVSENRNTSLPIQKTIMKVKTSVKAEPEAPHELPEDVKALQAEIARLAQDLKYEKMRADAYDTMIDLAEDTFKIPIRKKSGAEQ